MRRGLKMSLFGTALYMSGSQEKATLMLFLTLNHKINDPLEETRLDMGIFYTKMLKGSLQC